MAFIRSFHEKNFCLRTIQLSPSCRSPLTRVIKCGFCLIFKCSLRHPEEGTTCLWSLLALQLMTCPYLSHILGPPRRRLHLVVQYIWLSVQKGSARQYFLSVLFAAIFFPFQTVFWQEGRFALPEEVLRNPPQWGSCRN